MSIELVHAATIYFILFLNITFGAYYKEQMHGVT